MVKWGIVYGASPPLSHFIKLHAHLAVNTCARERKTKRNEPKWPESKHREITRKNMMVLLLLAYLSELVSNELPSKARTLVQIFMQYSVGFHLCAN